VDLRKRNYNILGNLVLAYLQSNSCLSERLLLTALKTVLRKFLDLEAEIKVNEAH